MVPVQPAVPHPQGRPPRILAVDDHAPTLGLVEHCLREGGFEVETAGSGPDALARFAAVRPDLVLLDIQMPGMDGLETCRRLRCLEEGWEVPVLFLTGDERRETQQAAIEAGGDDLIHKPSLHRELLIRIRSLLRIRHLQAALKEERDQLREAQEQRERLQQFLVHDLKSALQTVLCSTELLAETAEGPAGRHAGRILHAVGVLDRMIQDLLDIARSERGLLLGERRPIPVRPAVLQWIEEIRPQFERRGQTIRTELPEGLAVVGDPELLRRCFLNLMANANRYTPTGGEIRAEAGVLDGRFRLRVVDEGPGIPEPMRLRIFDPFIRLQGGAAESRSGAGLGLAFCRVVAQLHGGRIWTEPNEPRGAVFCLEFPADGWLSLPTKAVSGA